MAGPGFVSRLFKDFCRTPASRGRRLLRNSPTVAELLENRQLLAASGLQVVHRSGQSFITWQEDTGVTGEGYHVYRSASLITTANVSQAQKLTSKWGPLDDMTSRHALTGDGAPANFVIQDLGTALTDNQGLFVFTIQAGGAGNWYYAVTEVIGGNENMTLTAGSNSLASPITEAIATPQPVLVSQINTGHGRVYTQFMDYANWNPTFEGYAYNYSVALPINYDPSIAWPMRLMPHAYGERYRLESKSDFDWPVIEVFPDDAGGETGYLNSWWYGFAADHNYITNGDTPTSGHIENFTEQRLFQMMDQVRASFNVDPQAIHIQGNSMGASGALALGMRYGDYFSWIFASLPMTNYGTNPLFQGELQSLWGTQVSNLPIVNKGPYASRLAKYNNTGVYDWMNLQQMVGTMRAEPMSLLMVGHGKLDDVIDWQSQGLPIVAALNNAHVAFTAENRGNWDHTWMGFDFQNDAMFSVNGERTDWIFRKDSSLIAFSNASGSGPLISPPTGTDYYNVDLDWSVPWNNFGAAIIDSSTQFAVTLRSRAGVQTADVTPRRTAAFKATPGQTITWQNIDVSTSQVVQSGSVVADSVGLVTIPGVQILTNSGNRLVLTRSVSTPTVLGPIGTTQLQTPTITWSTNASAASYDLWVSNLTTGQSPMIQTNVSTTSYTPTNPMGIGRYRVWVRSKTSAGGLSAWSTANDFQINTPALISSPAGVFNDAIGLTWNALPGAVKYDLWINNVTTGQSQVIRSAALTTNSFQIASLPLGNYRAWVRGIDAGNVAALWSGFAEFTAAPRAVLTSPSTPGFNNRPTFQWQSLAGATKYQIYVRKQDTNAVVVNQSNVTANSFTPTSALPVGEYSWWVRAFNSSGIVGGWSVSLDFNVGGKPVVLTPGGTTLNRKPTFSWSPVQGANRYELWVSKRDGTGVVINLTNLTTTSYTPTTNLNPYDYRIWVRAVSTTGAFSSWSQYVDITVTRVQPSLDLLNPAELSSILVSVLWEADLQEPSKLQSQPFVVFQNDAPPSIPETEIEGDTIRL
ncbi:MAG: alpha/beta hydrolase-fold protein [Planctomycetota bacterium]|nr:alpha/beta hydrolase-fold protein [Planctomycetota bacterium]